MITATKMDDNNKGGNSSITAINKKLNFMKLFIFMKQMLFLIVCMRIELNILKYYFYNSIFTNISCFEWFNTWNKFKLMCKLACKSKNKNTNENKHNRLKNMKTTMCKDGYFWVFFSCCCSNET